MSDEELKVEETTTEETPVKVAEVAEEPEHQISEEEIKKEAEEEKLPGTEIHAKDIKPGMTIRVHERIKDVNAKGEERERVQIYQGIVLGVRGSGVSKTMTIRRAHKGYSTEKIFPLSSPVVSKIELVKTAKVRRAKLSYLQNLRRRFKRKFKETRAEAN
jgi:large subunit ribosomal protein L19